MEFGVGYRGARRGLVGGLVAGLDELSDCLRLEQVRSGRGEGRPFAEWVALAVLGLASARPPVAAHALAPTSTALPVRSSSVYGDV
jgi:hypothetical protein